MLRKKSELGAKDFETVVLACMVKPKFGPFFSRVGGDDRLIDKVNLR